MDPAAHGPGGAEAVGIGIAAVEDVVERQVQGVIDGYKQW